MTREMYVSSTPHETKVALVEDEQLAEIFFERENEYTLAGSIYKGRVTRVLPGMQSAFVDIGLERDAFLYVSDFLELPDDEESEFDEIAVNKPETFVTNRPAQAPRFELRREQSAPAAEPVESDVEEEDEPTEGNTQEFAEGEANEESEGDRFRRRRRRGRRGRGFPESKFARVDREEHPERGEERESSRETPRESSRESFGPPAGYQPIVLPGESLSKYRGRPEAQPPEKQRPEAPTETAAAAGQPSFVIESEDLDFEPVNEPEGKVEAEHSEVPPEVEARERQPEAPRQPRGFQPRGPIVLPGESIAKYRSREEQRPEEEVRGGEPELSGEAQAQPEEAEAQPAPAAPVASASAPVSEVREEHAPSSYVREDRPRFDRGRRDRDSRFGRGPRTEREPQEYAPTNASFTLLPGESISKYRNAAPVRTEEMAREQAEHAAEQTEHQAEEAASFVIESEPFSGTLEHEVMPAAEPIFEAPVAEASTAETLAPAPADETGAEDNQEEKRVEQMNVAAVFGGDAVEPEPHSQERQEREEPSASPHEITAEQTAQDEQDAVGETFTDSPESLEPAAPAGPAVDEAVGEVHAPSGARARDEQVFGHAGEGSTLEHEEIEGEEEEGHFRPEVDEESDADYIELVEETLDADHFTRALAEAAIKAASPEADELTAPPEEPEVESPSQLDAEENGEFDEDAETEFEEEELVGEGTLPEGQQEEAIGRAEVRGPSPTASYQRNVDRPYDRRDRDRSRRGGRQQRGRMVRRHEAPRQQVQISDLLKEGQEVLIQIAKEPIGKKGARITSHIALPGRFLVYMPTVNHIGVSRKITSDEERQRLKRIMISEREGGHGGFIVRTAAAGIGEDELRADIRFLKNLWAQIKQRAENSKAPALIYHDLNLVERILRDLVTSDFTQIWVDNEQEYERILNFANRFQPALVRRVKLYTRDTPLFEQFGVQEEINKALKAKVWLKSGGYIVINQTEALVAIDINTGKYVGKTARLEDTIVKTNVDAIREIVRQIRLRDLGGIIVIDFIDMDERKNRQKVMLALEEALKADRSPSKVLAFNDFGLVAITRKRVKQSLERTLGASCPYCTGNGYVKSVTTVCNEIYVELRKMARHLDTDIVNLRVNPEVAKALKTEKGKWLTEFEEVVGRPLLVKPDPLLHQEQFDIH